jgi:hypothetical protein
LTSVTKSEHGVVLAMLSENQNSPLPSSWANNF